jgi:hypothetical protein
MERLWGVDRFRSYILYSRYRQVGSVPAASMPPYPR